MKNLKWFSDVKKSLLSLRAMKLSQKYLFTVALGVAILLTTSAASAALLTHFEFGDPLRSEILAFDEATGAPLGTGSFVGGDWGSYRTFLYGPDKHLYVTDSSSVQRFNGTTGAFIDSFVPSGSGGLARATGMTFGPDGQLYVSAYHDGKIRRYNGTTGAFIDVFATTGSLLEIGLAFSPTGVLYAQDNTGNVYRINGTTGAIIDNLSVGGSGDLTFGPDDNLYAVAGGGVKRFNGVTGAFMDSFVPSGTMDFPRGMEFGPDGNLYVLAQDFAYRFDGTTGAGLGTLAENTDGFRHDLTFMPSVPVPEPGLGLLLSMSLVGLIGVGVVRRFKKREVANS